MRLAQLYPNADEKSINDALFHYTTAEGVLGILTKGTIHSTNAICTNDHKELHHGSGYLESVARNKTSELITTEHEYVDLFRCRGVDIYHYADSFEELIRNLIDESINIYITCFCKHDDMNTFHHGLLSQWRGYGVDGGYAIQFSESRLRDWIEKHKSNGINYDLSHIRYMQNNDLRVKLSDHSAVIEQMYMDYLEHISKPISMDREFVSPLKNISNEALTAILEYRVYTKSHHFSEESEHRLSRLHVKSGENHSGELNFYSRDGLIIPYLSSPSEPSILDAIDSILIGPSRNADKRQQSLRRLVQNLDRRIHIRQSGISLDRI